MEEWFKSMRMPTMRQIGYFITGITMIFGGCYYLLKQQTQLELLQNAHANNGRELRSADAMKNFQQVIEKIEKDQDIYHIAVSGGRRIRSLYGDDDSVVIDSILHGGPDGPGCRITISFTDIKLDMEQIVTVIDNFNSGRFTKKPTDYRIDYERIRQETSKEKDWSWFNPFTWA